MKFELNSEEIDHNKNVGTNTIKRYISLLFHDSLISRNAWWNLGSDISEEHFNFCMPLSILLGFCEDYKCVVVNAEHATITIALWVILKWSLKLNYSKYSGKCFMSSEINKLSLLHALAGDVWTWIFAHWICVSIPCCKARPSIRRPSRLWLC